MKSWWTVQLRMVKAGGPADRGNVWSAGLWGRRLGRAQSLRERAWVRWSGTGGAGGQRQPPGLRRGRGGVGVRAARRPPTPLCLNWDWDSRGPRRGGASCPGTDPEPGRGPAARRPRLPLTRPRRGRPRLRLGATRRRLNHGANAFFSPPAHCPAFPRPGLAPEGARPASWLGSDDADGCSSPAAMKQVPTGDGLAASRGNCSPPGSRRGARARVGASAGMEVRACMGVYACARTGVAGESARP